MKRGFLFVLAVALGVSLQAQRSVEQLNECLSYSIAAPVELDSTDNNGKGFDEFSYLDFGITSEDCSTVLRPNEEGFFLFEGSQTSPLVKQVAFKLFVTKPEKVKFSLVSSCPFKADFALGTKEKRNRQTDTTDFEAMYQSGVYEIQISLLARSNEQLKILYQAENSVAKPNDASQSLTLEEMLGGRYLYSVSLSPKGAFYLLKYYDTDRSGKRTWSWDLKRTGSNEVLYSSKAHFGVSWLPKSEMLYYTEKINGRNSLVVLQPESLEKTVLAQGLPEGEIAFLHNEQGFVISVSQKFDKKKQDLERLLSPDDRADANWRNRQDLWLYRLGEKALQRLTFSHHNVSLCDISPDDGRLLISVYHNEYTKRPFGYSKFYELDLKTLTLDTLFADSYVNTGKYYNDSTIVFLGSCEGFGSVAARVKKNQIPSLYHNTLFVWNRNSKAVAAPLAEFNPSVNSFSVEGEQIIMVCTDKDSVNVYTMNLNRGGKAEKLLLPCDVVGSYSTVSDNSFALFIGQNYNKPERLFEYRDSNSKEIYFPKQKEYAKLSLGKMEVWNNKTKHGMVEGRYYLPSDFDPNKKYPLIVYYYGGCVPSDRMFISRYNPYLYTARGYIVYVINPSGTIGYGQEFAARHVNAWGKQTADDIIESVKAFCKTHDFVAADKIGCMGASYGGFMTQYLISHSDIFAAAMSHAGISNITSYWGEGYWGFSYSAAASADSYPWNNPSLYTKQSPLFSADKINTPLLLLHGTVDTNVPIGESIQMYNALKILGKTVEFVSVKGEDHGIMDYKKRLAWNNTIYAWFDRFLKGESELWESLYPKNNIEQ